MKYRGLQFRGEIWSDLVSIIVFVFFVRQESKLKL